MMKRIWLAALLGIVLCLGLAAASGSTTSPNRVFMQLNTAEAQPKAGGTPTTSWQTIQSLFSALLAGTALGIPLFLVAKRRNG